MTWTPRILGYCLEQTTAALGTHAHRCGHVHHDPGVAASCQGRMFGTDLRGVQYTYEVVPAIRLRDSTIVTERSRREAAGGADHPFLRKPVPEFSAAPPSSKQAPYRLHWSRP